jgi:hypothetical protein
MVNRDEKFYFKMCDLQKNQQDNQNQANLTYDLNSHIPNANYPLSSRSHDSVKTNSTNLYSKNFQLSSLPLKLKKSLVDIGDDSIINRKSPVCDYESPYNDDESLNKTVNSNYENNFVQTIVLDNLNNSLNYSSSSIMFNQQQQKKKDKQKGSEDKHCDYNDCYTNDFDRANLTTSHQVTLDKYTINKSETSSLHYAEPEEDYDDGKESFEHNQAETMYEHKDADLCYNASLPSPEIEVSIYDENENRDFNDDLDDYDLDEDGGRISETMAENSVLETENTMNFLCENLNYADAVYDKTLSNYNNNFTSRPSSNAKIKTRYLFLS